MPESHPGSVDGLYSDLIRRSADAQRAQEEIEDLCGALRGRAGEEAMDAVDGAMAAARRRAREQLDVFADAEVVRHRDPAEFRRCLERLEWILGAWEESRREARTLMEPPGFASRLGKRPE